MTNRIYFPFLLSQADQGDLEEVKKRDKYEEDPEFRKAIDDALKRLHLQELDMVASLERTTGTEKETSWTSRAFNSGQHQSI